MPSFCGVIGCGNRGERDVKSFYRLPGIPKKGSQERIKLIEERRSRWINALKRNDLSETKLLYLRICEDHFISGKPSTLEDSINPDWVPSRRMGYGNTSDDSAVQRFNRSKKRQTEEVGHLSSDDENLAPEENLAGKRSDDPQHPDYVPSKFDHNKKCGPEVDRKKIERYERSTKRLEALTVIGTPSRDKLHPDYVPPVFSYGRSAAKRTARKSMKSRIKSYSPDLELNGKNDSDLTESASEDEEHLGYVPNFFSNKYDTGKRTARKSMKSGIKLNSLYLKPVKTCSRSTGTPSVIKQDATTMTELTGVEIDRLQKNIKDQTKVISGRTNFEQLPNKFCPGKVLCVVSMQQR